MTRAPLAALVALTLAACAGVGNEPIAGAPAPSSAAPQPGASSPATPSTIPTEVSATPSTSPSALPSASASPTPSGHAVDALRLETGDRGEAVRDLQRRLRELGYWLPEVTGVFDKPTRHAVVALQKAAGIGRDGIVGPHTRAALAQGIVPVPRTVAGEVGTVVEIDRTRQLLLLVIDGTVTTFDTSTGRSGWRTTLGTFRIEREIDGYRTSYLGVLYRPKYFHIGIAIHGAPSVPPYPASHGCVRVINAAMDWLWDTGAIPIGTPVWVY